jgi:hypothetical protein
VVASPPVPLSPSLRSGRETGDAGLASSNGGARVLEG